MPFFRHKKKKLKLDKKEIETIVRSDLEPYIKREEVRGYLAQIEKDKNKKEQWDALSPQKKIKILRYVARKRADNVRK